MASASSRLLALPLLLACEVAVFLLLTSSISAQAVIPSKPDGFLYRGALPKGDSVVIDAFLDPLCPDSRDAWPALKQAVQQFAPRVSLAVHTFPLPYHDNAFVASRALHIVDGLDSSKTYSLLEAFFFSQGKFYNEQTKKLTREDITTHIAKFTADVVGPALLPEIQQGFTDDKTDMATRIAFKYAASRGVTGAPVFFVNGFVLPGAGSPVDFDTWENILAPLVGQGTVSYSRRQFHFFDI